jgi:hypothetical protein
VWILWATIVNTTTGSTPANAVQYGPTDYDGTQNLGAHLYYDGNAAVGKVIPVATITPPGVNAVVKAGWYFNRRRFCADFDDGLPYKKYWDSAWQDDTSDPDFLKLTPDASDNIYDNDGPNIAVFSGADDSCEANDNFQQFVTWNGSSSGTDTTGICSDFAPWCWQARAKESATPNVTFMIVNTGSLSLPGTNGSYYKQVSGVIKLSDGTTPLAGVSVSAPCTSDVTNTIVSLGPVSDTTGSDGSYTIVTVPPGSLTLTPSLAGYTFMPPTMTLTVSTTAQVTGANFTATGSP